jgi:serine/threonine-protein kinase
MHERLPTPRNRSAESAREAYQRGQYAEAAQLYAAAMMYLEVGVCFSKLGRHHEALQAYCKVDREHPSYRHACIRAVRIASEHNRFDLGVDHFLSRYLEGTPSDEHDLDAFERVARLHESRGMPEAARDLLVRVAAVRPGFRDAARRVDALRRAAEPARVIDLRIAEEAVAFHGVATRKPTPMRAPHAMAALPELPELPPLPASTSPRGDTVIAQQRASAPKETAAPMHELDAMALAPETVLAGRYRIEKKIGEGGMAAVYRAHDVELDEAVALKTFQGEDPQFVGRFKQEVALSRQLGHPNVIRLYDLGAHGRLRFLTMELLEGRSLDACLGRPMDVRYGIKLLMHVCAGLGAAHARGIVHRDIKPANFFLTRQGTLKLMDFGIARRESTSSGLTVAGFIAGTPHYMSPEQINNFARADAISDLYSVGCLAFEMFTGTTPYDHDDLMGLLMMHVQAPVPSMCARVPQLPEGLDLIVQALLAKDPAQRPRSCDDLAARLRTLGNR